MGGLEGWEYGVGEMGCYGVGVGERVACLGEVGWRLEIGSVFAGVERGGVLGTGDMLETDSECI